MIVQWLLMMLLVVVQRGLVQRLDQLVAAHRVAEVRCHSHRVVMRPDAAVAQSDAVLSVVRDAAVVAVVRTVAIRHDTDRSVEVVVAEQVVATPRSERVRRPAVDVTDAALLLNFNSNEIDVVIFSGFFNRQLSSQTKHSMIMSVIKKEPLVYSSFSTI